jgi:hypothetical protein
VEEILVFAKGLLESQFLKIAATFKEGICGGAGPGNRHLFGLLIDLPEICSRRAEGDSPIQGNLSLR